MPQRITRRWRLDTLQVRGLGFVGTPATCQASPSTSLAAKWPLRTQDSFRSRQGSASCPARSLQALVHAGTPGEDSLVDAGAVGGRGTAPGWSAGSLASQEQGWAAHALPSLVTTRLPDRHEAALSLLRDARPVHFQVSQSQSGVWDHHRHHPPKGEGAAPAGLRGWDGTTAPGLDQSRAATSVSKLTRTIRILQIIQGFPWDPDLFATR